MRYIELNPVRAGMVTHPGEYRWSSYAENANLKNGVILAPHPVYRQLGHTREHRQHAYRELFAQTLEKAELQAIRDALNQELVLGREDYKDTIETIIKRQTRPGIPGRPGIKEAGAIYEGVELY